MEKRVIMLYAITAVSLVAFLYIFWTVSLKNPSISNQRSASLIGNVIFNTEDNYKVGDNLTGDIIIPGVESNPYGVLLLTKNSQSLISKTFNLKDVLKKDENSGENIVKIEDLINYEFNETGNYVLMFSVLDLNINTQKEFVVK